MFKIGDRVRRVHPVSDKNQDFMYTGGVYTISGTKGRTGFYLKDCPNSYHVWFQGYFELVAPTPHVHAELIKAWADGAIIQVKSPKTHDDSKRVQEFGKTCPNVEWKWDTIPNPTWDLSKSYRIKPELVPDVVLVRSIQADHVGSLQIRKIPTGVADNKVKFTFDGETGVLKSVEMLK